MKERENMLLWRVKVSFEVEKSYPPKYKYGAWIKGEHELEHMGFKIRKLIKKEFIYIKLCEPKHCVILPILGREAENCPMLFNGYCKCSRIVVGERI